LNEEWRLVPVSVDHETMVATRKSEGTKGIKSHKNVVLRIRGEVHREPIITKFCRMGVVVDLITCANFGIEKLRALDFTRVQVLVWPPLQQVALL